MEQKFIVTKSQLLRMVGKSVGSDLVASGVAAKVAGKKKEYEKVISSNTSKIKALQAEIDKAQDGLNALNPNNLDFGNIKIEVKQYSGANFISLYFKNNGDDVINFGVCLALAKYLGKSPMIQKNPESQGFSVGAGGMVLVRLEFYDKLKKFNGLVLSSVADIDKFLSQIK